MPRRNSTDETNFDDRITELEAENADLQERLQQREHEAAELADVVFKEHGRSLPARAFLISLWIVMTVRIITGGIASGNLYAIDLVVAGVCTVLIEHWVKAQWQADKGACILKSLFVLIALTGLVAFMAVNPRGPHDMPPFGAFLFCSFPMLIALSPFCEWLVGAVVALVHHPVQTIRECFGGNGS